MRTLACLALLLFVAPLAASSTIWVPDDHPTIQAAIDAATDRDTIKVRAGMYQENLSFFLKDVRVESVDGPLVTTIDGSSGGPVVSFLAVGALTVLDGFTLTGGTGTGTPALGGGVYCTFASPQIVNCIVEDNDAFHGAGMYFSDSFAWIERCQFRDLLRGGIYGNCNSSLTILDCRFEDLSHMAILIRSGGTPKILRTSINNIVGTGIMLSMTDGGSVYECSVTNCAGSGIWCSDMMSCTVNRCNASNNGEHGIYTYVSYAEISDCTILHNAECGIDNGWTSTTVQNCLIVGNGDGGIFADASDVSVENCTIAFNSKTYGAGGIDYLGGTGDDDCEVTNSILWGNTGTLGPEIRFLGDEAVLEYSNIEGGQGSVLVDPSSTLAWGAGMIDADPLFLNPGADNYRLQQSPPQPGIVNPCVDAGHPGAAPPDDSSTRTDWELDGGVVDLGFHYPRPEARRATRNPRPNPDSLEPLTYPYLGSVLQVRVWLANTTGHSTAALMGFSDPLTHMLPGGQVLLVDPASPSGELLGLPWKAGLKPLFTFNLPLDPALAGYELSIQAIHFGGLPVAALSNALDVQLGF